MLACCQRALSPLLPWEWGWHSLSCRWWESPAQGSWSKHIPPGWSTHLSLPGSHTLQKMCKVSQSLRKVSTKNTSDAPSKPQRKAQVEEKLVSISCPHQTAFCPNSRSPLPHWYSVLESWIQFYYISNTMSPQFWYSVTISLIRQGCDWRTSSQMNQALGQRPCSTIPALWASPSLLCKNHSVLLASNNTNAKSCPSALCMICWMLVLQKDGKNHNNESISLLTFRNLGFM